MLIRRVKIDEHFSGCTTSSQYLPIKQHAPNGGERDAPLSPPSTHALVHHSILPPPSLLSHGAASLSSGGANCVQMCYSGRTTRT